jgi:VCBS repeat-containing protein
LISLTYTSDDYLNRDNVPLIPTSVTGQQGGAFDFIRFTIEDDGLLIDPTTVNDTTFGLISNDQFFAPPRQHTAITIITVTPQNDFPIPSQDIVSVGSIGQGVGNPSGTTTPIDSTTTWSQYFVGLGQPVPVPTEDQQLVIPAAFLILNDRQGNPLSTDENAGSNDGTMRIASVNMLTAPASGGGSVVVNSAGDVVFTAPKDYYGNIVFTYVLQDSGIDESTNGNRVVAPLTAVSTVTVAVQPVNDPPVAFDRQLTYVESGNAGFDQFSFTAQQLLTGSTGELPAAPGSLTPLLVAPFNEAEQSLRVVGFSTGRGSVDVNQLANYAGPGTGSGTLTLATDAGGRFEFDFTNGAATNIRFFTRDDYNEVAPFNPVELLRFTIEDNGQTTDPQTGAIISLPAVRSVSQATLRLTVKPTNDAPIFTLPAQGFIFNENDGSPVSTASFATTVAPGPLTALDELRLQDMSFTFAEVNVPVGLMKSLPIIVINGGPGSWPGTGLITAYPAADAFGFAVYDVTATDNHPTNPRSTTQRLTITINPLNDKPVTYGRSMSVLEAVESDATTARIDFDARRLIEGNAGEVPSVAGLFPSGLISPYNEAEQALRVVRFIVPGAANVDVTVDEAGLVAGTGSVIRRTVTGGTLTFNFVNGAFTNGSYIPATDYNERTPFQATDPFSFVIQDDAKTTLPGSGFVNYGGTSSDSTIFPPQGNPPLTELRSDPAVVTLTVLQRNDPPIFTIPAGFSFSENNGQAVVGSAFATSIAPSEMTALDELARQGVTFSFTEVNVPGGLMTALPTLVTAGTAGNWPASGNLTVFPAADAFGFAVYDVTATDNDPINPRTTTKRLTITINPINDKPVAYARSLSVREGVESDGDSVRIDFDATRLITGFGSETPSVAGIFPSVLASPYNEFEQSLRVVRFIIPGATDVDVAVNEPGLVGGNGTVTRTTATGGMLSFTFVGGAFTSGSYVPATDYNERTPFAATDPFSFVIQDDAKSTLPGSGFINFGGNSFDTTLFPPQGSPPLAELRSDPATVTITVTEKNDPPIFTMANEFSFNENSGTTATQSAFVSGVAPSQLTARDELLRQQVIFTFREVNVPVGLMTALPRILVNGGPGNWPGSGTLEVFPSADAFGFAVYDVTATDNDATDPRSTTKRLTIAINPINDNPATFDRTMRITEAIESDGQVVVLPFDANRLISGGSSETSSVAGVFQPGLIAPYNEIEQSLRVVRFLVPGATPVDVAIDEPGLTGGTGQVTRTTVTGGKLTFNFANGAFTNGTYEPEVDYNENSVDVIDPFGFVIQDNARTTLPGSGFINYGGSSTDSTIFPPQGTPPLREERSLPATVTIVVTQTNDPPEFVAQPTIEILERDDSGATRINTFATAVRPAPSTAFDELATQFVSFTIIRGESVVPNGLMRQDPVITVNGGPGNWPGTADIRIFPSPDAVGTAIYVYEAIDSLPSNPNFVPQSTRGTVTIQVRPVNDAPRPNPAVAGTSASLNADEAWSVNPAGVITFTLKEDNTQSGGSTQPYSLDARANLGGPGYSRLGLLDAFVVGPSNEADSTLGGSQNLRILSFDQTTARGGSIQATAFDPSGYPTTFSYTPPKDYNLLLGAVDSFNYVVEDFNAPGQTWNLGLGGLQQNRLTVNGRAEFLLRPVNDAPLFNLVTQQIAVLEDSGTFGTNGFATDIFAGPLATAIDEVDPVSGQKVSFLVTPTNPSSSALFASAPAISPSGRLTFTPAKDAYGTAVFEVRAVDTGANDINRGDLAISAPQTITINIRPQNDNPILNTTNPIVFSLNEDGTILNPGGTLTFEGIFIPLRGTTGNPGLLDVFGVGPANEAADITPGGNQKLVMANPIPASTAQGGTLTKVFDPQSGELIGLRYMPRQNYNGTDSFIFGVIDDGVSANLDGSVYADPKESFTIVSLVVRPLNDAPQFSGAMSVTVLEDAVTTPTVGQTIIPGFATDIAAGPPGAFDELGLIPGIPGQTVSFVITPMATNPAGLFSIPPAVSPDGRLTFVTAPDANGVASFTIYALDSGAHNPPLEINRSGLRTFSVTVTPVNDPPSFNLIATQVQVAEDSGPFTSATPFATNILPGPPDEVAAGQTVRFEVTTPGADQTLFSALPTVTDTGFLRFTPATSAVGRTVISIVAIDSEGMPSQPKLVTLTIGEVNDPPIASNVSLAGDEDHVVPITAQSLIALATDPDLATNPNESLRVTNVSTASQSGATIRVLASGNIEYDPRQAQALQALRPGQQIVDTFTYQIVDSKGALSNVATISITVAGINDAPTVVDDFATLNPVGPIVIRPLLNDFDVDGTIDVRTVQISLLPAFGTIEVRNDGTLLYTPFEGFRGTDTLRYTVADDLGARSESATITIDTNQAPIAVADQAITYRDRAVDINVAANDSDPDGSLDLNSVVIVSPAARGTTIVLGGGIVRYVPQSDFVGIDTFRYTIRDNRGRPSNIADVRVQVVASELQNPSNATDVDASGQTSPIDALLILNRLARSGQPGIPIENLINELPRRYYDVDGNRMVEPLDALLVINHIARQNATGEGESDLAIAGVGTINATPPIQASRQGLNRVVQLDFTDQNLVEDVPTNDSPDELWIDDVDDGLADLIGLLAKDQDEKTDSAPIEDIDRAFGGLDL